MTATSIKPTHKTIQSYYEALQAYRDADVHHEGATETAFQRLLADTGKSQGWMLVPKLSFKRSGKTIIPDGTFRDLFNLHRGYWEAKDTSDDLRAEIRKKTDKGYPLTNTIFEDTRRAVLFQNGKAVFEADLAEPQQLCDLLNQFYAYTEPDIAGFEQAVEEFKLRVPELAAALSDKIKEAHKQNADFQQAFADFLEICRVALNPNLSEAAIDEMLVQHLLTERLIRTIFEQDDFTQKNVIAAEVEKVIAALVKHSFSRKEFLKQLDRFYRAIEAAARNLEDFSEKQHFLNTVYERFFQGYSVKTADTHGIVYTPQPIVDFMCASVVEVLKTEFGKEIGDKDVFVLDPCTGTGNFIVNLLRRIPKKDLKRMYHQQLFANEVMLLPYYIAALNIEHAYYDLTGKYEPFDGLCFVDTLDLVEKKQATFGFMNEENTQRVQRQKESPITVVIGNPPYNMGQLNENDNNKNRKYDVIDQRIAQTYAKDSQATLLTKLYDPYVKFFRWASDRLGQRDGIVCLVTNNSFIDNLAFDGMRKSLLQDFSKLYHLHLEGNVRQNPKLSGTAYNVFGIQVGVGITLAVRRGQGSKRRLLFHRIDKHLRREAKLDWLVKKQSISNIKWAKMQPTEEYVWLAPQNSEAFKSHLSIVSQDDKNNAGIRGLFGVSTLGVNTARDAVLYDFQKAAISDRVENFCEAYNSELDRFIRKGLGKNIDDFLDYSKVKWSSTLKEHLRRGKQAAFESSSVRRALYRPFSKQFLCYDKLLVDRPAQFDGVFPNAAAENENRLIMLTAYGSEKPFMVLLGNGIADLHFVGAGCGTQCFPFYVYNEDGSNRRENITDWALQQFQQQYGDTSITKWDVFYYVYGLLHHPGYREKYADNLKRELPRIPFAPQQGKGEKGKGKRKGAKEASPAEAGFWAFSKAGKRLAELHLDYEKIEPYALKWIESPDVPLSYRVEKMKLSKDKTSLRVNDSLTLADIPPEVFEYRLGNRSALDWVIDQYQVSEDKRSGIVSDPNRTDDPEYIVRLVGQVVRVSLETVDIVKRLPAFE